MNGRAALTSLIVLAGCAEQHGREEPNAPPPALDAGAGAQCPEPASPTGSTCGARPDRELWAEGLCADADGTVTAFVRADAWFVDCVVDDGALRLVTDHCRAGPGEPRDFTAACDLGGATRLAVSRGDTRRVSVDLPAPGSCVTLPAASLRAVEPTPEPSELCTDPANTACGRPVRFSVSLDAHDSCSDSMWDGCDAWLEGGDVVVRLSSAPYEGGTCEPAVGERVANCAVALGAPGRYPVRTEAGRRLGEIAVGPGEPTAPGCDPVP